MKLTGIQDTTFSLSIIGYQFPEIQEHTYDANWLLVAIDVTSPHGSWQATDPSLETFELAALAAWLKWFEVE